MQSIKITPELALAALSPATAFQNWSPGVETSRQNSQESVPWDVSSLNPLNRIDSLSPSRHPAWRIDGCSGIGTQFYAAPTFLSSVPPFHIHTFIPMPSQWPDGLRSLLQIDSAFLYRDSRICHFRIAQHILRTLERWSRSIVGFQSMYEALPFGSQIVFENMDLDISRIRIQIVPTYDLERQLMSASLVASRLSSSTFLALPPTLDISNLHLIQQIHDSTALVQLNKASSTPHVAGPQLVVFKTLSDSSSYMYHELSTLLMMPPHPNIISAPLHLITKKVKFGAKIAVVGFTLPYFSKGSLRDLLPKKRIENTLALSLQVKWALQVTAALIHIRDRGPGWYCDLRLDNMLLTDNDDLILIDFEQRGVLPSFAAPEIRYLDYILTLVKDPSLDSEVKEEYRTLYRQHLGLLPDESVTEEYHGSKPWLCQVKAKRETLQMYMLGRVLWCIFEGVSAPQVELWMEYLHDPDIEFPIFRRTPISLRPLILKCTQGWTQQSTHVKRRGNWLVKKAGSNDDRESVMSRDGFKKSWEEELEMGKAFLKENAFGHPRNVKKSRVSSSPSLHEASDVLKMFQREFESPNKQQ
jgi:hypothetical protein